jgi:hypothetical protein
MTITLDNITKALDALKEAREALCDSDPAVRGSARAACTAAIIGIEIALKRTPVTVLENA